MLLTRRAVVVVLAALLGPICGCAAIGTRPNRVPAPFAAADARELMRQAATLLETGHYAGADSSATRALSLLDARESNGSLAVAEACDLIALALARGGRFEDPRAEAHARRSLAVRERRFGQGHVELAKSLLVLGEVQRWSARDSVGIPSLRRALTLRQEHLGHDHLGTAEAWYQIGWGCIESSHPSAGDTAFRQALSIQVPRLGLRHLDVVQSIAGWAQLKSDARQYAEAESLFRLAVPRMEELLGADHPVLAMTLANYASTLNGTGRQEEALEMVQRALRIRESRLGTRNFLTGWAYLCMGEVFTALGEAGPARPYFERGLEVLEAAAGHDSPRLLWPLGSLAHCLWRRGAIAEAIPLFERSLEIAERHSDHHRIQALVQLSDCRAAIGEFEEGRALAERALKLVRAGPPPTLPAANAMDAVARHVWPHDGARARELWERAAWIYRSLAPGGTAHMHAYNRLAWESSWRGDHEAARRWRGQARAVLDGLGGRIRASDEGWLWLGSGQGQRALGRPAGAREDLERSLACFEAFYGPDHVGILPALDELAATVADLGRAREALALAQRAARLRGNNVFDEVQRLPDAEAIVFATHSRRALHLMLSLAAGPLAGDEEALRVTWEELARSRAVALGQVAGRHLARESEPDSELAVLRARAGAARARVAVLKVRGLAAVGYPSLRSAIEERDRAEGGLARRVATLRLHRAVPRADLQSVFESLPPGSALVGLARYRADWTEELGERLRSSGAGTRASAYDLARYAAFVKGAWATAPKVVPLGRAERIDSLVAAWREQAAGRIGRGSERAYRRAAEALRRAVWDPIATQLGPAERVFVVPDGTLHFVNWATLPVGGSRYLAETGPTFHLLYSEHDLKVPPNPSTGHGLLAFGAPDFDASESPLGVAASVAPGTAPPYRGPRARCPSFQAVRFAALPHAERELESVVETWRRSPGVAAEPIDLVQGAGATEAEFKHRSAGRRALHLATHGFWIGENCPGAGSGSRGVGGMVESALLEEPPDLLERESILLSGLALAGANRRNDAPPDRDDGILTADEIAALDLTGVEWAVLSACETGTGQVAVGEGVLGTRRALRVAGARTVVLSLWSVDDRNAAEWMRHLYEARFVRGRDTADAVREASLETLRARREAGATTHPSAWGAFIAVGDWH